MASRGYGRRKDVQSYHRANPPRGKSSTNEIDAILTRAHFLGLKDVILYERLNGETFASIQQIDAFNREARWVKVNEHRFDRSTHLYDRTPVTTEVGDETWFGQSVAERWIRVPTDYLIKQLMQHAAQRETQEAKAILDEAAAMYPDCKVIYDPYGYRKLVYALTIDDGSRMVKLGFTRHSLHLRVASLNTGNPYRIKPVLFTNKVAESYMHQALREYRVEGSEWFNLDLMDLGDSYGFPLQVIEDIVAGA